MKHSQTEVSVRRSEIMLNGILNVYKEPGFTSNDVVAKLRGILHQKKIGHAGTLDPAAEGVLPILLGSATRLSEYVMNHEKSYRTVLLLGVITDTQDMTGKILSEYDGPFPDENQVRSVVLSFLGGYEQLPPMYSAKKSGGKKLYDLAREGKEIPRKKVPVRISDIRIERISLPEVTFSVDCSKGTYIRTLCHDIGERLGCGGAMKELMRTMAGGLTVEDALTLKYIEDLAGNGKLEESVIPCEVLFSDCARLSTPTLQAQKKLLNGNALTLRELGLPPGGAGELIRMCTKEGQFTALYRFDPDRGRYLPWRMLL